MVLGLGIDLVDNSRVAGELAKGQWLAEDGIFSPVEIAQCTNTRQPALRFAGCFAMKEATLKALGIAVEDLGMFREVEVTIGHEAQTAVRLHGRLKMRFEQMKATGIRACAASTAAVTTAMVVLQD